MKQLLLTLLLLCPLLGIAQTEIDKKKNKESQQLKEMEDRASVPASAQMNEEVVIVRASQQLVLTEPSYTFRKLIMEDNAKLILKNPTTTIIIDSAYFGRWCTIDGRGMDGKDGRKGRNGTDYKAANSGQEGEHGGFGDPGVRLKLAMTVLEQATSIRILLTGGDGGKGGNGGNGGWKNARCGTTTTGASGGNGGNGGAGGYGGSLKMLADSPFDGPIYLLSNRDGKGGVGGLGGYPGRVKKVSCPPNSPAKIRQGTPGKKGLDDMGVALKEITAFENKSFPVDPPPPSAKATKFMSLEKLSTLAEVDGVLSSALRASGYDGQLHYLNYPGGYALVTRIERIHEDGTPLENDRFSPDPSFVTEFSLRALLNALLKANKGYFRVIAFIVTDQGVGSNSQAKISREDTFAWFSEISELPAYIGRKTISPDYRVEALIYEFSISENGEDPVKSEPVRLEGEKHLRRATIWDHLNRR